ncbi:subunit 17 of mediator complex-domain-containing protein [Umbelopsis sp. PMI_123]|nr:subunit 17 of mediator complex-domain-containing protein [Umbelopsis sp. PMI_123]
MSKRVKISLEAASVRVPVDISENGVEIFKEESTFQNKLMENVNRIWFERGEWKNISGESLEENVSRKRSRSGTNSPSLEDEDVLPTPTEKQSVVDSKTNTQLPFPDPQKLRESVVGKLNHAKSEIDVALDVINMLLSQSKSSAVKDLVLPPNTLQATYVSRPKHTAKHEVDASKLALGSKRKQLNDASKFLLESAASLGSSVQTEQDFWDEALEMRRKCWLIQPGSAFQSFPGTAMASGERSFYVQYGFGDVGSKFKEPTYAEMSRAYDKSIGEEQQGAVQMLIPHTVRRHVVARLVESHIAGLDLNFDYSEKQLSAKRAASNNVDEDYLIFTDIGEQNESLLQQQLQLAQTTVFESELFHEILSEARSSNVDAKFIEDGVLVNIDVHNDLILELKKDSDIQRRGAADEAKLEGISDFRKIASVIINISMHLLLLRRYRYNVIESRRKLFRHHISSSSSVSTNATAAHAQGTAANRFSRQAGTGSNVTDLTLNASARSIPLFSFLSSQCKLLALVNRVRHAVSDCIASLCGEGGLDISVHYNMINTVEKLSDGAVRMEQCPHNLAINLTITVIKGQCLRYSLRSPCSIIAQLPQTSLTLTSVQAFTELFKRQLNLLCLQMICDEANHILQHSGFYPSDHKNIPEKQLWTVDEVEEKVNGLLLCKATNGATKSTDTWRRIVIEPDDEILTSEDGTISTCKQFSFTALGNKDLQLERLEETLVMGQPQSSVESVLEFRQRARMLLKQWMSNVQKQLT